MIVGGVGDNGFDLGGTEFVVEEGECMSRDLVRVSCFAKNSKRLRWDCSFVIRSRCRWGKCG